MKFLSLQSAAWLALSLMMLLAGPPVWAQIAPLQLGVGLFQPDRERNDAT